MNIPQNGLLAFLTVAKEENMTKASSVLGLTQSALSQRITNLEKELEVTLFYREGKKLVLTDKGESLLNYAQSLALLESEFLKKFNGKSNNLAGVIRIGAFSSILRSMVIPALTPLIQKYPEIQFDFQSHEISELPGILKNQKCDLIFLDYDLNKSGIVSKFFQYEEYVSIRARHYKGDDMKYLDHGPLDNITESFFIYQNQKKKLKNLKRSFINDVYAIIDAVELGFGKAIMSKHLILDNKNITIEKNESKVFRRPIIAHYYENTFYPELFKLVLKEIEGFCSNEN
jgi:DNA-binding transcriptional LysR family regulator